MRLCRYAVLACLLLVMLAPGVALAQACTEIRFARGASSAVVAGQAPAQGAACYTIGVGSGQTAQLGIEGAVGLAFSVRGVADNRAALTFTTRAGVYRIDVYQTFRAVAPAPFRLGVSVTGGGAAAAPSGSRWTLLDGDLGATGTITLADGTELGISCSAENATREMAITARALPGLSSVDGAVERASFVILRRGAERRHPVLLRRYAGGWWRVEQGLTRSFLDDYGAGDRMSLVGPRGQTALTTGLSGTSAVRRSFARYCAM